MTSRRQRAGASGTHARLRRARTRMATQQRVQPSITRPARTPRWRTSIVRSVALRSATRTAPTPPPDPTERRAAWLSSWGTFASAIAAVVGLVVSALATYYTGLALRDQQATNRDQNAREHRSQALQVGFWYTNSQVNKGEVAVVSNRSPDAIYQLTVRFTFPEWPSGPIPAKESGLKLHEVKAEYTSASLPPCTQMCSPRRPCTRLLTCWQSMRVPTLNSRYRLL